jgi:hypothetical protein
MFLAATLVALLLLVPGNAGRPAEASVAAGSFVSVSLPALKIEAGERVVGFDFEVTSGRIAQIRDAPIGWNISVSNDPSWNTTIHASVIVAAAALDGSFFKDFVVLEKQASGGSAFELKGKIIVSTDFTRTRTIPVGNKDLKIRSINGRE